MRIPRVYCLVIAVVRHQELMLAMSAHHVNPCEQYLRPSLLSQR